MLHYTWPLYGTPGHVMVHRTIMWYTWSRWPTNTLGHADAMFCSPRPETATPSCPRAQGVPAVLTITPLPLQLPSSHRPTGGGRTHKQHAGLFPISAISLSQGPSPWHYLGPIVRPGACGPARYLSGPPVLPKCPKHFPCRRVAGSRPLCCPTCTTIGVSLCGAGNVVGFYLTYPIASR